MHHVVFCILGPVEDITTERKLVHLEQNVLAQAWRGTCFHCCISDHERFPDMRFRVLSTDLSKVRQFHVHLSGVRHFCVHLYIDRHLLRLLHLDVHVVLDVVYPMTHELLNPFGWMFLDLHHFGHKRPRVFELYICFQGDCEEVHARFLCEQLGVLVGRFLLVRQILFLCFLLFLHFLPRGSHVPPCIRKACCSTLSALNVLCGPTQQVLQVCLKRFLRIHRLLSLCSLLLFHLLQRYILVCHLFFLCSLFFIHFLMFV
mmetsp:Transcript_116485/g.232252  ORF Transcript_116485/g.232252 Transcript_116485/m.232252 type:complete len:259 (+) Transcript_116485:748-1524(+)